MSVNVNKQAAPGEGEPTELTAPMGRVKRRATVKVGGTPRPARRAEFDREALLYFRKRLKNIGKFVQAITQDLAGYDPELWTRGAYMMLIGNLVAVLAEEQEQPTTARLAKLSKILAEQRGVRAKSAASREQKPMEGAVHGPIREHPLPAHFGEVVRQIYGTTLQDDVSGSEKQS